MSFELKNKTCGELAEWLEAGPLDTDTKRDKALRDKVRIYVDTLRLVPTRAASDWWHLVRTRIAALRVPLLRVEFGGADSMRRIERQRITPQKRLVLEGLGYKITSFEGSACIVESGVRLIP